MRSGYRSRRLEAQLNLGVTALAIAGCVVVSTLAYRADAADEVVATLVPMLIIAGLALIRGWWIVASLSASAINLLVVWYGPDRALALLSIPYELATLLVAGAIGAFVRRLAAADRHEST